MGTTALITSGNGGLREDTDQQSEFAGLTAGDALLEQVFLLLCGHQITYGPQFSLPSISIQ